MASYTYFAIELGDEHALGCKCCRFSSGTDLPVPKKLTNAEIADLARKFSHQIFADWTRLNAILKRYEEVIQKRWLKKNGKKRRAILLEAWPHMAPTHRPDFVGFRKAFDNTTRSRTMLPKSYLWPYINLEDLIQRHHLLLFINSRGRNLPDKFISADIEAAHLGKGWQTYDNGDPDEPIVHFDPEKHKDDVNVLALYGEHGPLSYGKIVSCDGPERLKKSASMYHPCLGLLGLEIQKGIYSFVLECAKLILHDKTPDQFFLAPHKPAPAVPTQPTTDEWLSFAAHTLEAPYRVPQMLDLERLKDLVSARRSAAEDHIWLLRDDPGYFLDTLKDWKEHDTITVKHSCSRCYNVVAARMITDAFTYFFLWDHLSRCLQRMRPMEEQLKLADLEHLRLPPLEEATWAEILEVVDFFIWSLKANFSDSDRRVTGLVFAIVDNGHRHLHSLNHILQEFQYMMDTDPMSNQLIDSWINSQVVDLALLSELKLRIEGLQPWQTAWKARQVHAKDPVNRRIGTLVHIIELDMRDCIYAVSLEIGFDLLNDPLDGRLEYPVTKACSKANVDQMRRAEKELEKFWQELDGDLEAATGRRLTALLKSRSSGPREKHRTAPWKQPVVQSVSKAKVVLHELDRNMTIPHATSATKPHVSHSTPKAKTKTPGVASSPAAAAEPAPRAPAPDAAAVSQAQPGIATVQVSKRAFKVLDALAPAPTASSYQHAEVARNELLLAMDEVGLQPEKLYGSVWVFRPRGDGKCKVDVSRNISFHEPKEVRRGHKIPPSMVRTFGRRLKHAHGWFDGMFVRG